MWRYATSERAAGEAEASGERAAAEKAAGEAEAIEERLARLKPVVKGLLLNKRLASLKPVVKGRLVRIESQRRPNSSISARGSSSDALCLVVTPSTARVVTPSSAAISR